MYDPRLVPIVDESVESRLIDGCLTLISEQREFHCDTDQALLWALCTDGHSSIGEINFQFDSLEQASVKNNIALFINTTLKEFAALGLLSFQTDRLIDYPIDITSYRHFASTRGGVYAVGRQGYKKLAYGMFFGLCFDPSDNLLAFDFPQRSSRHWKLPFSDAKKNKDVRDGVIRKFSIEQGQVRAFETAFTSLANNIHEMVRVGDHYYAVDTEGQAIQQINGRGEITKIEILKGSSYHHINALRRLEDGWIVMKSISSPFDTSSGFALFNLGWQLVEEVSLPAHRAHDLVLCGERRIDNIQFWYCDSKNERIVHYPSEQSIAIEPVCDIANTTRGLVDAGDYWLVGAGKHGRYVSSKQDEKLAALRFIDKQSQQAEHSLRFPESPCGLINNPWFNNEI